MAEPIYFVRTVTGGMILQDEQLGTKDKYWCRFPDRPEGEKWLLKLPRQEDEKAEHLAEKIACEVAKLVGVPCAEVELAEYEGIRGTVSRNMVPQRRSLVHGNEIIAGRVTGYDPERKRRTSDHTWERIVEAIEAICGGHCDSDLEQFAGYLVLDALVGNTDRHHENWGFLRRERAGRVDYSLAPSFDHASSLGREMKDERRKRLLAEGQLEARYIRQARGGIYLKELGENKVPPLVLVESLAVIHPRLFSPWLQKLSHATDEAVCAILQRMPPGWITSAQAEFASAIIAISRNVLQKISCH